MIQKKRYIIHIDCNCFYAAVEMLRNPRLRYVPMAVCGSVEERHGVVLTANYIAKKHGVKTGITVGDAIKACPELYIVPPRLNDYIQFSGALRAILSSYSDHVEAFSIDECWVDISCGATSFDQAELLMTEMCRRIENELGLSVSAGLADSKVIAKIASERIKPNGRTIITPESFASKVWPLPIGELMLVGGQYAKHLQALKIMTIGDLAKTNPDNLQAWFGVMGQLLFLFANGVDNSEVAHVDHVRQPANVSHSFTFPRDLVDDEDVQAGIYTLSDSVGAELYDNGLKAKTISIMVTNTNLTVQKNKQSTLPQPSNCSADIAGEAFKSFKKLWHDWPSPLRKLGIQASNFDAPKESGQITLFDDVGPDKKERLEHCLYDIRAAYGNKVIQRATMFTEKNTELCTVDAKRDHKIHPTGFLEGSISVSWENYSAALLRSVGQ